MFLMNNIYNDNYCLQLQYNVKKSLNLFLDIQFFERFKYY